MAENTPIEWCHHHSFNGWWGCAKISQRAVA